MTTELIFVETAKNCARSSGVSATSRIAPRRNTRKRVLSPILPASRMRATSSTPVTTSSPMLTITSPAANPARAAGLPACNSRIATGCRIARGAAASRQATWGLIGSIGRRACPPGPSCGTRAASPQPRSDQNSHAAAHDNTASRAIFPRRFPVHSQCAGCSRRVCGCSGADDQCFA